VQRERERERERGRKKKKEKEREKERKRESEREREKEREIEKEREFVGPGGECLWCLWVLVSPSWGMEFIMRGGHNIICPFTHNVEKIKHQTKIMFSLLLIIELMTDSFI
jgi:hypothetical protein